MTKIKVEHCESCMKILDMRLTTLSGHECNYDRDITTYFCRKAAIKEAEKFLEEKELMKYIKNKK